MTAARKSFDSNRLALLSASGSTRTEPAFKPSRRLAVVQQRRVTAISNCFEDRLDNCCGAVETRGAAREQPLDRLLVVRGDDSQHVIYNACYVVLVVLSAARAAATFRRNPGVRCSGDSQPILALMSHHLKPEFLKRAKIGDSPRRTDSGAWDGPHFFTAPRRPG